MADASDAAELRLVDHADVYKAGRHAATLRRDDHGVHFSYLPGYLEEGGRPVARTLRGSVDLPANYLPPFLAGLLPEGRRLAAVRQTVGTSADDEFSLLLAVGADTIGDVAVVPSGEGLDWNRRTHTPIDPSTTTWPEVFARSIGLDQHAATPERAARLPADPAALPGAIDKLSGRMITLPASLATNEVILKLEPAEFPGLVRNEAFFLRRAADAGLRVVEARILTDRAGNEALAVRRFDRSPQGPIAVEDACQLLGRTPGDKYRIDAEAAVIALAECCPARAVACKELFEHLLFAYLSGNNDQHAKNLAVLGDGTASRPSPGYDLPSGLPYPLDHRPALPVNGRLRRDIGPAGWLHLAERLGVPERVASRSLARLTAAADTWPDRLPELGLDSTRLRDLQRRLRQRLRIVRGGDSA